ncbi:phosphoribosylformylglycinamidine synthase subunit PurL [Bdellovibrio sp. HCB2-146]|uniref:phosphoribosylformylglycinamidine synthase subunit PurL n=1 Tax=Bdellovibrio sp. HCB2-146 TaxID=3394362 RepID=UPI0039BD575E
MKSLRLVVSNKIDKTAENNLLQALRVQGPVENLRLEKVFWLLEREAGVFDRLQIEKHTGKIFFDPIAEDLYIGLGDIEEGQQFAEIRFLAGVTDNWARSATEALALFSDTPQIPWQNFAVEVHSGWQVKMTSDLGKEQIQKVLFQGLANPLLQKVEITQSLTNAHHGQFENFQDYWKVPKMAERSLALFDLNFEVLQKINLERGLALNDEEINTIIQHFSSTKDRPANWQGKITEVELECLAQTWSEHCKHKIFAAEVDYSEDSSEGPLFGSKKITSLYKSYIQKATKELEDCGYLVSVFKDNAGIVDFDNNINVCVKVETHNSPSALDPFGGAITGILGVNRDILGCGLGAKPVANMDVFCLSHKNLFPGADSDKRPSLLKNPDVIFRGVHAGVEEGGNQSGIPTINGSFCFASNFSAKPLIFVGSVGVMPKTVKGAPSEVKNIKAGDKIVVAGGRLGKDGVHGATFSSLELHDQVASNVVQIGDSITQKRLLDFTLMARDRGLIAAITDNGAGGVSSSIGEMATMCGGARMDLSKHPLKYPGLEYWEMLVSESQERMSYAVAPENLTEFLTLAQSFSVEATCLGEFTDSGYFEVLHGHTELAKLDLHFLHEGLSRMKLKAHFEGPKPENEFHREKIKPAAPKTNAAGITEALKKILSSPNVASKEALVRYYDHEVQAATRVKPYSGSTQSAPSDAGVLDLSMHGGEKYNGLAVSNGLCPQFSAYDTYLMAQRAVDEAVRNLVATGANPEKMALVDNFCWPDPTPKASNPDASHKMAQLVRACAGLYEAAKIYRAPLVSGKDSMKNDFIGKTQGGETVKISVPPTLLMTAIAQVPDTRLVTRSYFNQAGDLIYLLGKTTESLYGSVFADQYQTQTQSPEYPDLQTNKDLYIRIYEAQKKGLLQSCHDVSDGGLISAITECCFGEILGADLSLNSFKWENLWSETGSNFVVSVKPENQKTFEAHFTESARQLGTVQSKTTLSWTFNGEKAEATLKELFQLWSEGVTHVYHA